MPIPAFIQSLREQIGHELLLLPGVSALVFNERGEVLLQRRVDSGRWGVIGGIIEPGEEPAEAVVREVLEETGVRVVPLAISGVYTTPVITYPNGDRAQYVLTAFLCRAAPEGQQPRACDDESLEVRYFPPDALPGDLPEPHRLRIVHAQAHRDAWPGGRAAFFVAGAAAHTI